MSRPIVGDIRTQKFKRTQKNGDIYVYERTVKYNPEKGFNETISSKLISKIVKGTDIEVPTRTRKTKDVITKSVNRIYGPTRLCNENMKNFYNW